MVGSTSSLLLVLQVPWVGLVVMASGALLVVGLAIVGGKALRAVLGLVLLEVFVGLAGLALA